MLRDNWWQVATESHICQETLSPLLLTYLLKVSPNQTWVHLPTTQQSQFIDMGLWWRNTQRLFTGPQARSMGGSGSKDPKPLFYFTFILWKCFLHLAFFFFFATPCSIYNIPTREWTHAPCRGSKGSDPLDHQGILGRVFKDSIWTEGYRGHDLSWCGWWWQCGLRNLTHQSSGSNQSGVYVLSL